MRYDTNISSPHGAAGSKTFNTSTIEQNFRVGRQRLFDRCQSNFFDVGVLQHHADGNSGALASRLYCKRLINIKLWDGLVLLIPGVRAG